MPKGDFQAGDSQCDRGLERSVDAFERYFKGNVQGPCESPDIRVNVMGRPQVTSG